MIIVNRLDLIQKLEKLDSDDILIVKAECEDSYLSYIMLSSFDNDRNITNLVPCYSSMSI